MREKKWHIPLLPCQQAGAQPFRMLEMRPAPNPPIAAVTFGQIFISHVAQPNFKPLTAVTLWFSMKLSEKLISQAK